MGSSAKPKPSHLQSADAAATSSQTRSESASKELDLSQESRSLNFTSRRNAKNRYSSPYKIRPSSAKTTVTRRQEPVVTEIAARDRHESAIEGLRQEFTEDGNL